MKFGDAVSIVVVSYNSSATIIETLNSIYYQDYQSLELVVTDDRSTDKTIDIVAEWLRTHKDRFFNKIINVQKENGGTAINIAAGMQLSTCSWTKSIAADDILLNNCISNNVRFVIRNVCNSIVCSRMIPFKVINNNEKILQRDEEEIHFLEKLSLSTASTQYKYLLKRDTLSSPTMFVNMEMYRDIGGYDTTIKYIEDWPFKLKLTRFGYKICFLNLETIRYRIGDSASHSKDVMYNQRHLEQVKQLKKQLCYPNIPKWHVGYYYSELLIYIKNYIIIRIFNNNNNILTGVINKGFLLLIPQKWSKIIWRITRAIKFKLHNDKRDSIIKSR